MNYYLVFERDEKHAGEWDVSRHRSKKAAIARAVKEFRKTNVTHGVDLRSLDDDELIEEIGLVNLETGGEFVEHFRV